ncbi:hypothetical protein OHZ10_20450 [Burkholderia arboris]|uniref:Transcriptional regulator n=1 Tax=Burkholderia arboris TaxID=488730 RepID=A0ABZ3DT75_9BURK
MNPTTAHTFAAYVRGLGCAIKRLIMLEFGAGPVRRDAMTAAAQPVAASGSPAVACG